MISLLLYANQKSELALLKKDSFDVICHISEDDWAIFDYFSKEQIYGFLDKNPVINISCIDVTSECGIEIAEVTRERNSDMLMIILSDDTVPPGKYIKPSIMASSLLLRPISTQSIKEIFMEVVSVCLKKYRQAEGKNKNFVVQAREGRQIVPLEHIYFFEARDKKIYLYTDYKEYSYYDTLDKIEKELGDSFVRCHRSFIVAKAVIKRIVFSQNVIELINGMNVPVSRTYKKLLKELK